MSDKIKFISDKAGLPPGTLIHIGKRKSDKTRVSVIDYDASHHSEVMCESIEECFPFKEKNTISWINIDGLHNVELIASIGNHFGLHSLLVEDVLNTRHRPKAEAYENYFFFTLKMLGINKRGHSIISEQVSFVLGKSWVISFQEQQGDIFESLRQALRENKGNLPKKGADYLLYRLIDTVVDNYFFIIEYISDATEKLEEKVLKMPNQESLYEIQRLKKQLASFRRAAKPLREAIAVFLRDDNSMIDESTIPYLRDVYEHIIHVSDAIDSQRDILTGIMDLYLSGVSNKMNQIMQLLTIIATIFIPLTFIAGVYGMNFDNMPELHFKYGYHIIWIIMIVIFAIMIFFFRKKKWL
jgi:magnesium transporter